MIDRLEEIYEKQIPLEELSDDDKKLLFDDIDGAMADANEDIGIGLYKGIRCMTDL
jgi:hypothetical protein